jgi:hypothetical protein
MTSYFPSEILLVHELDEVETTVRMIELDTVRAREQDRVRECMCERESLHVAVGAIHGSTSQAGSAKRSWENTTFVEDDHARDHS